MSQGSHMTQSHASKSSSQMPEDCPSVESTLKETARQRHHHPDATFPSSDDDSIGLQTIKPARASWTYHHSATSLIQTANLVSLQELWRRDQLWL